MVRQSIAAMMAIFFAASAYASEPPVVIFDNGLAVPVMDAVPGLRQSTQVQDVGVSLEAYKKEASKFVRVFPLTTSLKPGKQPELKFNEELPAQFQSFFVVGADELSVRWLNHRKSDLVKFTKLGYVVHASTEQEFLKLKELFPEFTFVPATGDFFTERLGVTAFPFFINSVGVFQ